MTVQFVLCDCTINLQPGANFTKKQVKTKVKSQDYKGSVSTDMHGLWKFYTKYEHCISYDLRLTDLTSSVDRVDARVDIDGHTDK